MKKSIFILIFLISIRLFAAGQSYYAGLGFFTDGLNRVSGSTTGSKTLFAPFNYPFIFKWGVDAFYNLRLLSSFEYTLLPRTSPGGGASENYLMMKFPLMKQIGGGNWSWGIGPALMFYSIQGKGGTTQLNNGSGYSTFGNPGRTMSSRVVALNAAFNYEFNTFLLSQELIIEQPFSNDRRNYAYMISFNYKFGESY